MVWIVEKKVFHHFFDLGFETVRIPIRVKFEFEVKKGILVPGSISKSILYNLDPARLQQTIEEAADNEIQKYLQECGYLKA